MKLFNKLVNAGLSQTVASIGTAVDGIITNDEERGQIKNELTKIVTEHTDSLVSSAKDAVLAEANGNWLQRSWRPIIMLAFGFIVVYEYFLANVFGWPKSGINDNFWNVMELGLGGYVIGRSVEKVTDSITRNFDKLPGKKN